MLMSIIELILEKHVKLKMIEASQMENTTVQVVNQNHTDPERGGAS